MSNFEKNNIVFLEDIEKEFASNRTQWGKPYDAFKRDKENHYKEVLEWSGIWIRVNRIILFKINVKNKIKDQNYRKAVYKENNSFASGL